jgi:hypothetical protein
VSAEAQIRGGTWLAGETTPTIKLGGPAFSRSDAYFKPLIAWQPEREKSHPSEHRQIAAKLPESF